MNQKKRRIITIVICIILAIVLIVPMIVSVVPAEETEDSGFGIGQEQSYTGENSDQEYGGNSGESSDQEYGNTGESSDQEYGNTGESSDQEYSDSSENTEQGENTADGAADGAKQEEAYQPDVKSMYDASALSADTLPSQTDVKAADGIYIEDVNVSGMTRDEVLQAFENKLFSMASDPIVLHMGEKTDSIPAGKMGLTCTNPEIVNLAMLIGQKGNVLRRYRASRYLNENGSIVLTMDLKFDEKEIRKALTGEQDHINIEPIPVKMVLNDDQTMTAVDKVDGLKMQIEESASRIREYLDNDWHGGPGAIELVSKVVPATGDVSQLADVKDLIGDGSTEYDESEEDRFHNIQLAAEIIDGTVLYPGEEFDFNKIVGETTEENGFVSAGSYENGEIVESFGGGICQASTTLYRAVLEAELDVTERHPHSMTVKYVEPAFDAAIAEDVKNFRFVNNKNAPIYIHGTAGGGVVRFEIYGKETRDPSRTLSFESRTISETEYTTQFVYDDEMEAGDIKSTGGRYGLVTELWKLIYENGELTDQVQVNESEYIMAPLTYHIGTQGASEDYIARMDDAIATQSPDAVKSALGG